MANKTLKEMFPEYSLSDNKDENQTESSEATATREAKKAASELISILDDDKRRTERCVFRLSKKDYSCLNAICRKKGLKVSAVMQMFAADFIRENEHLLDE